MRNQETGGAQARRAAARRFGANWTEMHRKDEEAARKSPLHQYVFHQIPWLLIVAAAAGAWHLTRGETAGLPQLLALGIVGLGGAGWLAVTWTRRWRSRKQDVLYERAPARRVRDRAR